MIQKQTPPHCLDCKCRTERVIVEHDAEGVETRSYFLCASCEYLRLKPDAPRAVKMPNERRPLKLQSETLFS